MRYAIPLLIASVLIATPATAVGTTHNLVEIRSDALKTGTRIRQRLLTASVPDDKEYAALSADEKARVRRDFAAMAPQDEPPYPTGGIKTLCAGLVEAQARLRLEGELRMMVKVAADGSVSEVTTSASPDAQMTRVAAEMLKLQTFKPAQCRGQSCAMDFPLNIRLLKN